MLRKITYQGVFEPTGGSGFGVYFPDLPGCTSYGETLGEAQKNAQDALGLHLYGMERDGDPVPAPSATPEVDPEAAAGHLVYPVTIFMLIYKGYFAMSEYSAEDHIFYGKILGIRDIVYFQSDSAEDIEREFHEAVDDYLEFCAEVGKEPEGYAVKVISIQELEANADKYVEMAQKHDILITENGKVVAKLTAAEAEDTK